MVACDREKTTSGSGSGDWQVQSITVAGSARPVHGKPHLAFDAKTGKVGGRLGRNAVNATATVRAGHITLGRPSTTRMMCDASLMGTERALLGLFNGRVDYRVDHDTATLTSANGAIVHARVAK